MNKYAVLYSDTSEIFTEIPEFLNSGGKSLTCVKKCTPSTGKWKPIPRVLMITRILSKFSL